MHAALAGKRNPHAHAKKSSGAAAHHDEGASLGVSGIPAETVFRNSLLCSIGYKISGTAREGLLSSCAVFAFLMSGALGCEYALQW